MTTSTKLILGIAGAVAAGVVIGILIAPEKGSDMRQKVKDTAGDWANKVSDFFSEGYETIKSKVQREASDLKTEAKQSYS